MTIDNDLPSFVDQFGEPDTRVGPDARSVTSPAAYLADLLQLIEDHFDQPDLRDRRGDIWNIPLDDENTFRELPYLTIVERLLEQLLPGDDYDSLRSAEAPPHFPFDADEFRLQTYLDVFEVDPVDLYRVFSEQPSPTETARLSLGLSRVVADVVAPEPSDDPQADAEARVVASYGLASIDDLAEIAGLSEFLEIIDVEPLVVDEVVSGRLTKSEASEASDFFVNRGLLGRTEIKDGQQLVWLPADGAGAPPTPPADWFDRVWRLTRLSRQTGIGVGDLDLLIRSCAGGVLDRTTLPHLAVAAHLADVHDRPVDVICALFADMDHTGFGDDDEPADLFNRTFNGYRAETDGTAFPAGATVPAAHVERSPITLPTGTRLLDDERKRRRVSSALRIPPRHLDLLVTVLDRRLGDGVPADILGRLSLYFRVATLAEIVDVSVAELFDLLDLIEIDPQVRRADVGALIGFEPADIGPYEMLLADDLSSSMWLVQTLAALGSWLREAGWTVADLRSIQTTEPFRNGIDSLDVDDPEQVEADRRAAVDAKLVADLNTVLDQVRPTLLTAVSLVGGRCDERLSRLVHHALGSTAPAALDHRNRLADGPEPGPDNRPGLAGPESDAVEPLLHDVLIGQLDVTAADFQHLGLAESMQSYLLETLVARGVIDADGVILDTDWARDPDDPATPTGEALEPIFAGFDGPVVHDLLRSRHPLGHDENEPDDADLLAVDLEQLGLSEDDRLQLYRNLRFNRQVEDDGTILARCEDGSPEARASFAGHAPPDGAEERVAAALQRKRRRFEAAPCVVNRSHFAALGLAESELDDLLANLRFNGYLDDRGRLVDKAAILDLELSDFSLVVSLHPHRADVLAVLKERVGAVRSELCRLGPGDLAALAEGLTADLVLTPIAERFLDRGRLTDEAIGALTADIDQPPSLPPLPPFLGDEASAAILEVLRGLAGVAVATRVGAATFAPLDLTDDETADLLAELRAGGLVDVDGTLRPDALDFFANASNAVRFRLTDDLDLSAEVFFAIHPVATGLQATAAELRNKLIDATTGQRAAVLGALEGLLQAPAALVKTAAGLLFDGTERLGSEILRPLLAGVAPSGRLEVVPRSGRLRTCLDRCRQLIRLAGKTGLGPVELELVFGDQNLGHKLPQRLVPPNDDGLRLLVEIIIDRRHFPTLMVDDDDTRRVLLVCAADGPQNRYWLYDADDYGRLVESDDPSKLSWRFAGATLDAGFNTDGDAWIVAGGHHHRQAAGQSEWVAVDRQVGRFESRVEHIDRVDAAFADVNATYLFAGERYLRSDADLVQIEPGYPRTIAGHWGDELTHPIPPPYRSGLDAALRGPDGRLHLFKDGRHVSSDQPTRERVTAETWGRVESNFGPGRSIDAAMALDGSLHFFAGGQRLTWSGLLEDEAGTADQGSLTNLSDLDTGLPFPFANGVDAAFVGADDKVHLFKDGVSLAADTTFGDQEVGSATDWGQLANPFADGATVTAALTGLDGRTYLFAGSSYVRYSGPTYAEVDDGHPRSIAEDWGGLARVDAAYVVDGKTYVIGTTDDDQPAYVRYSTADYTTPDELVAQVAGRDWWHDHFNLYDLDLERDFATPDAVFVDPAGDTHLFKDTEFITFDRLHRWWSDPAPIDERWAAYPFDRVDAAFTGLDGRTYLFAGDQFVRYSQDDVTRLDDNYPQPTAQVWGRTRNVIADTGRVDAALVLGRGATARTYLFSGDQYVCFTGPAYDTVDAGYPRRIAGSLSDEPGFSSLPESFDGPIDAAVADRRTAHLLSGDRWHSFSDELTAAYELPPDGPITSVVVDQGQLFAERGGAWHQVIGLESFAGPQLRPSRPPTWLRSAPAGFRAGIDAGFVGADGSAYVFKGNRCYNDALGRDLPVAGEWGRTRNAIAIDERVDAGFVGLDGKTYLFRGSHVVAYDPVEAGGTFPVFESEIDLFIDDDGVGSIAERWGGLDRVNVAYVSRGVTYLVEPPDEDGTFRYVRYSTDDYSRPDHEPRRVDPSWWAFPDQYVSEGFDRVDSVIELDGHRIFVRGDRFIQYDVDEDIWTYPRPIELLWPDLPFAEDDIAKGLTGFVGVDGSTYVFAGSRSSSYPADGSGPTAAVPLADRWARERNNFADPSVVVDAAAVVDGVTYLLSGDQYVRYSTADYRFVDEGYPRTIDDNLASEPAFQHLAPSVEHRLADASTLVGVVADDRAVYLWEATACTVCATGRTGRFGVERIGRLRNEFESGRVDAALANGEGQTFLFSGDQYIRYSGPEQTHVDVGYPKPIVPDFAEEVGGVPLDDDVVAIDACVALAGGATLVFAGDRTYSSDEAVGRRPLADSLPGPVDLWSSDSPVDGAFADHTGAVHYFRGPEFVRYGSVDQEFVDEGYPKPIEDNWGALSPDLEAGIDGAFTFEERTFLVKGSSYTRFVDPGHQRVEQPGPRAFGDTWGRWSDYAMADLRRITRFADQASVTHDGWSTLVDLLGGGDDVGDPYATLSGVFGWAVDDIKYVKRRNAFLDLDALRALGEVEFNIEIVLRMIDIFRVLHRCAASPGEVHGGVYRKAHVEQRPAEAADALLRLLRLRFPADWETLEGQLDRTITTAKVDAALAHLLAPDNPEGYDSANDLFAYLLIDVEIGPEVTTSVIKEAVSAVQLYIHRRLVNLEPFTLTDSGEVGRDNFTRWWRWMRNYRVWEANRKVFLFPENVLRPELRDTKSPGFKKLEDALLQGELTDERVRTAFNEYLDEFATVGNLEITGANATGKIQDGQELVLFGRTRSAPKAYYYRTASFPPSGEPTWGNWTKVDITIDADRVYPVHAFGRVLVFWTEIEEYEESEPLATTEGRATTIDATSSRVKYRAAIKYSYYDYNHRWVSPQVLTDGIELRYEVDAIVATGDEMIAFSGQYCSTLDADNPGGRVSRIGDQFRTLPATFKNGIDAAIQLGERLLLFKDGQMVDANEQVADPVDTVDSEPDDPVDPAPADPVDEADEVETEQRVVTVRSIASVFGGEHDEEATDALTGSLVWSHYVKGDVPGYQEGVAAAFQLDTGVCLIDKQGLPRYFVPSDEDPAVYTESTPGFGPANRRPVTFWEAFGRLLTGGLLRLQTVDAGYRDPDDGINLLRNGQFDRYRMTTQSLLWFEKLDGYPKPIKGNLGFNLDRFFDKLHVAAAPDGSFVNLTYMSPKANAILRAGRVLPDFRFTTDNPLAELDRQRVVGLVDELSTIRTTPPAPTDSGNPFTPLRAAVIDLQTEVDNINDVTAHLSTANEIAGELNVTSKGKSKLGKAKRDQMRAALSGIATDSDGKVSGAAALSAFESYLDASSVGTKRARRDALVDALAAVSAKVDALVAAAGERADEIISWGRRERVSGLDPSLERHRARLAGYRSLIAAAGKLDRDLPGVAELQAALPRFEPAVDAYSAKIAARQADTTIPDIPSNPLIDGLLGWADEADRVYREVADELNDLAAKAETAKTTLAEEANVHAIRELYSGKEDVFPSEFGIRTDTNFTFGQPDWHVFEAKGGTFLCRPKHQDVAAPEPKDDGDGSGDDDGQDQVDADEGQATGADAGAVVAVDPAEPPPVRYDIVRLTTAIVPKLGQRLFAGGLDDFLTPVTQHEAELPSFRTRGPGEKGRADSPTIVDYDTTLIDRVPVEAAPQRLDFGGANGSYYWEIFYHAPMLVAGALNGAQKFDQAKRWYEYVYDPTAIGASSDPDAVDPTTGASSDPDAVDTTTASTSDAVAARRWIWRFLPLHDEAAEIAAAGHLEQPMAATLARILRTEELAPQIAAYLDDPFDPHAIARLRHVAYLKATVMNYVDNLLDWGDQLFGRYTIEDINEARMLYVLAYDLLGERPPDLGRKALPATTSYANLEDPTDGADLTLAAPPRKDETSELGLMVRVGGPTGSLRRSYFHLPANDEFLDYWRLVEDRLLKIRSNLNIRGEKQPLPLFQPPIDPMTLVGSVAAGAAVASAAAAAGLTTVPHYRFGAVMYRVKELTQKLNQFGNELLAAIEKQDAEALTLLQMRQELAILDLVTGVKEAQIAEIDQSIIGLEAALDSATTNRDYQKGVHDAGYLDTEIAQLASMSVAVGMHAASALLRAISSMGATTPDALLGPFITGIKIGGSQAHASLGSAAEVIQTLAEGTSILGETFGIASQHQRTMAEAKHQADLAEIEMRQIGAQIEGARHQLAMARRELLIHRREIEQRRSVQTFMNDKFTSDELYRWLSGQLGGLYFQTYKLAHDLAKAAERAFQFERGLSETAVDFIGGMYWDSQRKGLTAGERLGLDLDRMEAAFFETDRRRLEITKSVSLLSLDPLAFLTLKSSGSCEFEFDESVFDLDFPGHYCRQIKSMEVVFDAAEGETVNAMLTQLSNHTAMEPDAKAVKHLLDPSDQPPLTIRSDWRPNQQIALSHVPAYEKGNGLFELRYDDERYLPFEGTGAVSRWRLELRGRTGAIDLRRLVDATVVMQYTALDGGVTFANAVRGQLKPYDAVKLVDLSFDFGREWIDFLEGDEQTLTLRLTPELFPNMAGSRLTGLFTSIDATDGDRPSLTLLDADVALRHGEFADASALSVPPRGVDWTLRVDGDKRALRNVQIVVGYRAKV